MLSLPVSFRNELGTNRSGSAPDKNGSAILEMELGGLEEIERWVLSWGTHVRVLAPTELTRRIAEQARMIAGMYDRFLALRQPSIMWRHGFLENGRASRRVPL